VRLYVDAPLAQPAVLDALKARAPTFRGTIRDHATLRRRPFMRYVSGERGGG
jgi:hypothetical protein